MFCAAGAVSGHRYPEESSKLGTLSFASTGPHRQQKCNHRGLYTQGHEQLHAQFVRVKGSTNRDANGFQIQLNNCSMPYQPLFSRATSPSNVEIFFPLERVMVYTGILVLFPWRTHPDETVLFLARAGYFCGLADACAGHLHCAARELGCGWRAQDSGGAGGHGGALRIVSKREPVGLASHEARDADRDAICGNGAIASCGDAGRSAAATNVLSR